MDIQSGPENQYSYSSVYHNSSIGFKGQLALSLFTDEHSQFRLFPTSLFLLCAAQCLVVAYVCNRRIFFPNILSTNSYRTNHKCSAGRIQSFVIHTR